LRLVLLDMQLERSQGNGVLWQKTSRGHGRCDDRLGYGLALGSLSPSRGLHSLLGGTLLLDIVILEEDTVNGAVVVPEFQHHLRGELPRGIGDAVL
jgi:hypothetical protein